MGPATGSEPQHRPDRDDTYRGAARPSINDSSQVQPCGTRDFLKKRVFFQQSPQHGQLRHQKNHVAQLSAMVRIDGGAIGTTELHRCPSSLTGTYLRETKGLTTESKPPEHETESELGPATRPEPPAPKIDPDHRGPRSSEFKHPTPTRQTRSPQPPSHERHDNSNSAPRQHRPDQNDTYRGAARPSIIDGKSIRQSIDSATM